MSLPKSDSALLAPSFEKSVKIFETILDNSGTVTPQQLQVAMTVTKAYSRAKLAENQKALLVYQIARDYSQDKKELRNILESSIPNMKFITAKENEDED